jgi:hypothetical protein
LRKHGVHRFAGGALDDRHGDEQRLPNTALKGRGSDVERQLKLVSRRFHGSWPDPKVWSMATS